MTPKPRKCRVRGCKSITEERFFSFPQDPIEIQKWRDNLQYKEWDFLPSTTAYVCSRHFEESAMGIKYLRKGAIPTLNLGYDDPPPHKNHSTMGRVCYIENCLGDVKRTLYRFPANSDSWFKACNIDRAQYDKPYICELHFDKKFLSKTKLLPGAFPTLNLPPQTASLNACLSSESAVQSETLNYTENKGNKHECCIKICRKDGNATLFAFPTIEEVRTKWIKLCRMNPDECGELYICSRHFHSCFLANGKKILKDGALPSLNLFVQPEENSSSRILLPTLQKRAVPPKTIKYPLDFEQHYFVESKRKRLYSHDSDENSKCISLVSENEELIGNIQDVAKSSDAVLLHRENEHVFNVEDASLMSNSTDLDGLQKEKLFKCDNKNLEKRLLELQTRIEFQTENNDKVHCISSEKKSSESEGCLDFKSKPTHTCYCDQLKKRIVELEARLTSELEKTCKCDHENFEKRITELEAEVEFLKTKHRILADRAITPFNNASREAITFARMIVDSPNKHYTEKEKYIAQNLTYLSPKAYDFMREELKFILPHKTILRRWRPTTSCTISGIDAHTSATLKNIVSQMSERERICQIMFDEAEFKTNEELSSLTWAGKGRAISKYCLFMLKGILSDWSYVLSYYFEKTGFNAYNLLRYLNQNLVFAESVGLKVKVILCEQSLCNSQIYKMLYVTEKKPYILHENEKIHCFYDYFHLIKYTRNSFIAHDIQTSDGVVRFKIIRKLYAIDKVCMNLGLVHKLSPSHLYPNNVEKNDVYLAAQLLSTTVSVAIETAINQNIFGSDPNLLKCAKATQKFIRRMNNLFDVFNHRDREDNSKENQTSKNYTEKIDILNYHLKYLHSLEEQNTINLRFISGLILTVKSMINFCEDVLNKNKNMSFHDLGMFHQDALNMFFEELRKSKDNNACPTEIEILALISSSRRKFEQKLNKCKNQAGDNLDTVVLSKEQLCDNTELTEEQFDELIEVVEDCLSENCIPIDANTKQFDENLGKKDV